MIQSHAREIHQYADSSSFIPVKLLLLIISVVKECQSQKQFSESIQGIRLKNNYKSKELLDLLGEQKLTRYDMLIKTVSNTIISILVSWLHLLVAGVVSLFFIFTVL